MKKDLRQNCEVVGGIYKTKDLGMFTSCKYNRVIDQKHVEKLVKSMKKSGYIGEPITVTSEGVLLDGHHRLTAARKLGIPVTYIIDTTEGDIINKIIKENEAKKVWGKVDFINANVAKGLQSYIDLENFRKLFPEFTLTEQLLMLTNTGNNVDKDLFSSGRWVCKDVKVARQWASDLLKLKTLFPKGYNKSNFVRVMIDIFSNDRITFDMDELVRKIELRRDSFYVCGNKQDYRNMIERCYNFGRRQSDRITLN
jgi:hypothetical protein